MITLSIACTLIISLFGGYLDSGNERGIAWAAKKMCHRLTNNKHTTQ
jgi:hypothetical protein